MPAVDRVRTDVRGKDRLDTLARQAGAVYQLQVVAGGLSGIPFGVLLGAIGGVIVFVTLWPYTFGRRDRLLPDPGAALSARAHRGRGRTPGRSGGRRSRPGLGGPAPA
jgi:hypothetical protein